MFAHKFEKFYFVKLKIGAKCFHGPERSMRVEVQCGADLKFVSVEEVSMCKYFLHIFTYKIMLIQVIFVCCFHFCVEKI